MESSLNYCPCCKKKNLKLLHKFQEDYLNKCEFCGLAFDSRKPSNEELKNYYQRYSYSKLRPCPSATAQSFLNLINEFRKYRKNGNILDIGCGQGDFLFEAQKHGWKTFGSEYSDSAISLCRNRGLNVVKEPISLFSFGNMKFDVITSFEVIEHIQTPNEFLETARSLLRPGGIFYFTTPNFNSILRHLEGSKFAIICYPEHLCFYSKKTIRHLSEKNGFIIKKISTTGIDLARLRNGFQNIIKLNSNQKRGLIHPKLQNDAIREKIQSNTFLIGAKKLLNSGLNFTGTGDTLKVWLLRNDD